MFEFYKHILNGGGSGAMLHKSGSHPTTPNTLLTVKVSSQTPFSGIVGNMPSGYQIWCWDYAVLMIKLNVMVLFGSNLHSCCHMYSCIHGPNDGGVVDVDDGDRS